MTKRPTIAIIGAKGIPFVYSGYETFVRELSLRLAKRYELHVYCHRGLFSSRPAYWNGVRLHYLPAVESKYFTHVTAGVVSTLHALLNNYDIYFYLNSANGPFGLILKCFGKRTVLNTDGMEWKRPQLHGPAAAYYRWASARGTRHFQTLVSDSKAMADVYEKEFQAPSEVIAYGADIDVKSSDSEIDRYGLVKNGYYLVVGRLIPDNNAELIIEGVRRSGSKRKLVIVGDLLFDDPYVRAIRRHSSGDVILTGFVRDREALRGLYRGAFAYLHGHEFGGTNPALLEALASGCCAMALDTPFNREVLSGEEFGMLFDKDPGSLARLIRRAENDSQAVKHYRDLAASRIESQYTWEKIASQYDELFQRLLSTGRR